MRLTHLPRTAEKSLRALHRRCIEPTRKGPTTTTLDRIVGPSQTRDRVEDDHYITAQLDPTASSLQGQFRNREMLVWRTVETGGDNLAITTQDRKSTRLNSS